jgi:hypothetical protein
MALRTQNNAQILTGDTLADRPAASTIPNAGVLFHDSATGDCSILQIHANGTHVWEPFCSGGSGGGGGWPDYVVSLSDPLAPFQSIGAAIAAASAAGHGPGDPAVVLVHPGDVYSENVTLRAGIAVVAFDASAAIVNGTAGNTVITGTVVCDPTDVGLFVLTGFTVDGTIACAAEATLLLNYITLNTTGFANQIQFTGTGSLQINNSILDNAGSGACINMQGAANLSVFESSMTGNASQPAIIVSAGNNLIRGCTVVGQIELTNNAFLAVEDSDTTAASLSQYMVANGATVQVDGGSFNVTPDATDVVAGTGSYHINNVVSTQNEFLVANSLTLLAPQTIMKAYATSNAGKVSPDFDVFTIATSGVPVTTTLPDTRTALYGQRITIKNTDGLSHITVNAAVGDTIDGAASYTIASGGPPFHAATFQCDPSIRNWYVIGVV